jgi:IS4 transposase
VPTRHGKRELYLLSTVPEGAADASALAGMHRRRWTIERAFLHLTGKLRCEVNTLSYPPAALFALACAMVVFNVLAVVKAALRAVHGEQVQASLNAIAGGSDRP